MRRRFQFSLTTLLVAMLVVAAFFGGMAVQRHIEAIRRARAGEDEDILRITVQPNRNHKRVLLSANRQIIVGGAAPADDDPGDW